jgi:hypothetical protein
VGEVETQPVRGDQRALLDRLRPEHLAQRRVQQVRARVVAYGGLARGAVYPQARGFAHAQATRRDLAAMHHQLPARALRVVHLELAARGLDHAAVADLPAGLGVEGRLADDQLDLGAGLGLVHEPAEASSARISPRSSVSADELVARSAVRP